MHLNGSEVEKITKEQKDNRGLRVCKRCRGDVQFGNNGGGKAILERILEGQND